MVGEEEITSFINQYLKKYGIGNGDFSTLRPKIQEQLVNLETFFQERLEAQNQLANQIRDSKLNLLRVVKGTGIQKSSVYNNPDILKKYIEERIYEIQKEDVLSLYKTEKQGNDFDELKSYLETTRNVLIESEIYEAKIRELESEIRELNGINLSMAHEINRLNSENSTLRNQLSKVGRGNIISFENKRNSDLEEQ